MQMCKYELMEETPDEKGKESLGVLWGLSMLPTNWSPNENDDDNDDIRYSKAQVCFLSLS